MHDDIEHLYAQHYPYIVSYIASLCNDYSLAEEIAQEAFLKAMKSIDRYKGKSSFRTWLCSIARNELLSCVRKQKVHPLGSQVEFQDIHGAARAILEEDAINKVFAGEIQKRIARFPQPQRSIAHLRLFEELSFKEISTRVLKPEVYCRVTFFRLKNVLRKEYYYE